MLVESARTLAKRRAGIVVRERLPNQHNWMHGLPFRVRFKKSMLYISILPVLGIGMAVGFIGSVLGIGGGFILVPALIYLLRVPGRVVIGTSLLQLVASMAATTVLHALQSQSVDILLAFCLMVGGTVGAQFGASAGKRLHAEQLRVTRGPGGADPCGRRALRPEHLPRARRSLQHGGDCRRPATERGQPFARPGSCPAFDMPRGVRPARSLSVSSSR